MKPTRKTYHFTAVIEREGKQYTALCPEIDIASQGATIEEARDNLQESLELFFETASKKEIARRVEGAGILGDMHESGEKGLIPNQNGGQSRTDFIRLLDAYIRVTSVIQGSKFRADKFYFAQLEVAVG